MTPPRIRGNAMPGNRYGNRCPLLLRIDRIAAALFPQTTNGSQPTHDVHQHPSRLGLLPGLIFSSRWLQLPLYLGLIVAQGVYVMLFLKELWHLLTHATSFGEMEIMLLVLGLIDVVMISNLLVMVIVGG